MDLICSDCPRKCGAKRSDRGAGGFCASPAAARVARAAPHFGEEPCISGRTGTGGFSGGGGGARTGGGSGRTGGFGGGSGGSRGGGVGRK